MSYSLSTSDISGGELVKNPRPPTVLQPPLRNMYKTPTANCLSDMGLSCSEALRSVTLSKMMPAKAMERKEETPQWEERPFVSC